MTVLRGVHGGLQVLNRFREILYGGLIGLVAAAIDIAMHARMAGHGLVEEFLQPQPRMTFYRMLYLVFGTGFGWMLWQRNGKERAFRDQLGQFRDLIDLFDGHATVIYTNAQMLLMRSADPPPEDAVKRVRELYDHMQKIRVMTSELSELADL